MEQRSSTRRHEERVVKTRIGSRQRWFTIGKHGAPWTAGQTADKALVYIGEIAKGKAAVGSIRGALKEQRLSAGGNGTFVQARTAHESARALLAQSRLQRRRGRKLIAMRWSSAWSGRNRQAAPYGAMTWDAKVV